MKTLIILRHAKAEPHAAKASDHDRVLLPKGVKAAAAMGAHLAAHGPVPELILCSDAARARETMEALLTTLKADPAVEIEPTFYPGRPEAILSRVREADDHYGCVMVIGHNPSFEDLARALVRAAGAGRGTGRPRALGSEIPHIGDRGSPIRHGLLGAYRYRPRRSDVLQGAAGPDRGLSHGRARVVLLAPLGKGPCRPDLPGGRSHQGLSHGRGRGSRAQGLEPRSLRGRIRGAGRPLGQRQIDFPQYHRRLGRAHERLCRVSRQAARRRRRARAHPVSPRACRLRVPVLQSDPEPHGPRERGARHRDRRQSHDTGSRLGDRRPRRPDGPFSRPAFGRPAAEGGHRPRHRQAARCALVRRAHGRAGHHDRRGGSGSHRARQQASSAPPPR